MLARRTKALVDHVGDTLFNVALLIAVIVTITTIFIRFTPSADADGIEGATIIGPRVAGILCGVALIPLLLVFVFKRVTQCIVARESRKAEKRIQWGV
jgi:hypothetical protein